MTASICKDFRLSCTGCGACAAACPKACIHFERDYEGFSYPVIEADTCISCGRCAKSCPNNMKSASPSVQLAWAFQSADGEALKSSSGGAFYMLALDVLARAGAVYGFALEGSRLVMKRAVDEAALETLRGSKYVQGAIGDSFRSIADDVAAGLQVLVCGTPCQIAGVSSLLSQADRERVLLIDFACHGVPSPHMFEEHAQWLAEKNGSSPVEVSFRDKRHAHWLVSTHFLYRFENGKEIHGNWKLDPYYNAYLKGEAMRECCYACRYATLDRASDITLADFWGLDEAPEGMRLRDGVSAVVAHTEKGVHAVEALSSRGSLVQADVFDVVAGNKNLARPTPRPEARDAVYRDIADAGYGAWASTQVTLKDRVTAYLADAVPTFAVAALVAIRSHLKEIVR